MDASARDASEPGPAAARRILKLRGLDDRAESGSIVASAHGTAGVMTGRMIRAGGRGIFPTPRGTRPGQSLPGVGT